LGLALGDKEATLERRMNRGIKFRLIAFVLAIVMMLTMIAGTALVAWRQIGEMRKKTTAEELKSFEIADHFQQTILELNHALLSYGFSRASNDWAGFAADSAALDRWIDAQRPSLGTEREKLVLDQINRDYDHYVNAARQIHSEIEAHPGDPPRLDAFATFETQSGALLTHSFSLADAHRASLNVFMAGFNKSLKYLRAVLLLALLLLLVAGAGLAKMVYRDMIAPLQVKLVESQELIERQEKLASLGMLAAGIAHEIRNPLTALKAWLFIQQKHLQPGTPEQADAEVIANEINRLDRMVRDFLLFARPSEPMLEIVPALQPLREARLLLEPQLTRGGIEIVEESIASASVRIDPQQIKQVLINLIQNAADSIGERGKITLRARLETRRTKETAFDAVILEVADTGKGIPPEVEKRLFDPFFTTKESGTGLGLSIAARIVEKHGGALQYQTQVNHGTTFGIVLPRA
jgi:signal transduction histidine kinase